jgi:hypothetical protein
MVNVRSPLSDAASNVYVPTYIYVFPSRIYNTSCRGG